MRAVELEVRVFSGVRNSDIIQSMSKKRTEEDYRIAAANSETIADMCRALGIAPVGGNYGTILRNVAKYEIDISHFLGQGHTKGKILKEKPVSNEVIKKRLILLRSHQCEKCKNSTWFERPITLELEHIDGDNTNNDLENLLLLCPNCHSQTPTWRRSKSSLLPKPPKEERICQKCNTNKSGRASICHSCRKTKQCSCGALMHVSSRKCKDCNDKKDTKIIWPEDSDLLQMISDSSYSAVGRNLGVSDNAIRLRLKRKGLL